MSSNGVGSNPAAIAAIEKATERAADQITDLLKECNTDAVKHLPEMRQAIILAKGMKAMRASLTNDVMNALFMPLQGSRIGFRTDKDKEDGYPLEIVRDCVIEAMVRGFRPVGNEFNIIAGNAYFTKEAFERRVPEIEGLTDLELTPGVPQNKDGGALVPYRAAWKLNGRAMEIVRDLVKLPDGSVADRRIPVRINAGQGADAILGKAKRKILAQIYDRVTGSKFSETDIDTTAIETTGEVVAETQATPAAAPTEKPADKPANEQKVEELAEKYKRPARPTQGARPDDPAVDSSGFPEPGANG